MPKCRICKKKHTTSQADICTKCLFPNQVLHPNLFMKAMENLYPQYFRHKYKKLETHNALL